MRGGGFYNSAAGVLPGAPFALSGRGSRRMVCGEPLESESWQTRQSWITGLC